MDFIQVPTNYYLEGPLVAAGEKAEVLFMRAKAYCADVENDGFVPEGMLPRLTPSQPTQRANALVRVELWVNVDGGRQFVDWDQITKADLEQRRADSAARQRRSRANRGHGTGHGNVTRDSTRDSHGSHRTEVEEEVEEELLLPQQGDAAAVAIEILADKLRRFTALATLRTDLLQPHQADEIVRLIGIHGDARLVDHAIRTLRRDAPPRTIQAFIGSWRPLPPPGQTLAAVPDDTCPEPGHSGTTRHCVQCASERLELEGTTR